MSTKAWGGRFTQPTDQLVEAFTSSIADDQHIALDDVDGSVAHATMLSEVGLITKEDGEKLVEALKAVRKELEAKTFVWDDALEDVHMNVEARLGELVGTELAGRLHTARSRNDQVALDARLYLRRQLTAIRQHLVALESAFISQAKLHIDVLMPGYTHLQRGQPVRLAHHLLAYQAMFSRDRARIDDALKRVCVSPLGAGALAGTPHPIDRQRVAELLGFEGVTANSMDSVASRDHFLEVLSAASISMTHLSRWSEELIMWSSSEFGFITIADGFTTGSSMMPQKKNPDVAELVRGRCGRVVGDLMALLTTVKGLPLTYNRDLQEDKPPLYDALSTWSACLEINARMLPEIAFHSDTMRAALKDGFVTATELADYLVTRGVPFREAHHVTGRVVGWCVSEDRRLEDLSPEELKGFDERIEPDVLSWLDPEQAVERRNLPGGPARAQVEAAIATAEAALNQASGA